MSIAGLCPDCMATELREVRGIVEEALGALDEQEDGGLEPIIAKLQRVRSALQGLQDVIEHGGLCNVMPRRM